MGFEYAKGPLYLVMLHLVSPHDSHSTGGFRVEPSNEFFRYIRLLAVYVKAEHRWLVISTLFGTAGLCLPFVFPGIIAALMDHVVIGREASGAVLSTTQRLMQLRVLTLYAAIAAIAFAVVGFGKGHYTLKLGQLIIARVRRDVFHHLEKLSLQFFTHERTGTLVWQLTNDVSGVANLVYAGVLMIAFDAIQLVIAFVCLWYLSWKLTLAVTVLLPVYFAILAVFNPRVRTANDAVTQHLAGMSGELHEQFSAISLVKTYGAEQQEMRRFVETHAKYLRAVFRQSRLGHAMGAISEGVIHLGTAVIVGYGGYLAYSDPGFTVGRLAAFIGYVGIMYGPVHRCADLNLVYQNSWASVRRVLRILDIQPQIYDRSNAHAAVPERGEIVFSDVSFRYPESPQHNRADDRPGRSTCPPVFAHAAINHVSLHVRAGQRVALVGPSGAGKTTIGLLLARLYDVDNGAISIDGVDLRDYQISVLRQSIVLVQQDPVLLTGSIRDNIAYGRPDASDADIVAAAGAANAHEFIIKLASGYLTELGERGVNLSGGQRQRLSIARAILKNPRILILDEATSSLDTESEFLVQEALERLMRGRTTIIIAHRLSTIKNADRIYAMQGGRIVESGTHDELLAKLGLYSRLILRQGVAVPPAADRSLSIAS